MKVRIPTPLRSYTGGAGVVDAVGTSLVDILDDLDGRYPGLRFRVVDEQGRLRQHMRIYIGAESVRDLSSTVGPSEEVTLMQALSGG